MGWLLKKKAELRRKSTEPSEPIEPLQFRKAWDYEGDVTKLSERAKEGDLHAARLLVDAGEIFARAVEDLFRGSPEGRALVMKIAAERIIWPSIASRHQSFRGGPEQLASYLKDLELGSSQNVNFSKQDPRTETRQTAARFLRMIAEGIAYADLLSTGLSNEESCKRSKFVRAGLERDPWRKSSHGKAAKAAIEKVLVWHYEDDRWLDDPLLAPIVEKAQEGRRSVRTIKTAFIREALNVIHGSLWD